MISPAPCGRNGRREGRLQAFSFCRACRPGLPCFLWRWSLKIPFTALFMHSCHHKVYIRRRSKAIGQRWSRPPRPARRSPLLLPSSRPRANASNPLEMTVSLLSQAEAIRRSAPPSATAFDETRRVERRAKELLSPPPGGIMPFSLESLSEASFPAPGGRSNSCPERGRAATVFLHKDHACRDRVSFPARR